MKFLDKAHIATVMILATAGAAVGTARADSVLAPLVISNSKTSTYFAFKMRGSGVADEFTVAGSKNPNTSRIHYHHLQKWNELDNAPVTGIADLRNNPMGGCKITNTSGSGSSWDIIYQDVRQTLITGRADHAVPLGEDPAPPLDESLPAGWLGNATDSPFVGMVIIDDVGNANVKPNNGRRLNEGELSGFVYIVNETTGMVIDYKLLNNPFSKKSGDFKTNWISKTSIDWMWLPANNTPPALTIERTAWFTAVIGEGMTNLAEQSRVWNESVKFTQTLDNYKTTKDIRPMYSKNGVDAPGAYNNDEQVLSGPKDFKITCMGIYDRTAFLTNQQVLHTVDGGFKRAHIVPESASGVDNVKAHGAITYRMDTLMTLSTGAPMTPTFTIETSGYLSTSKNKAHPNRGY